MKSIKRVLFLNQVTGPLFRDTAESIADLYEEKSTILVGGKSSGSEDWNEILRVLFAPAYSKKTL